MMTKKPGRRRKPSPETFPQALAALLRKRRLKVPRGLLQAPPEAYAGQSPSFVVEKLADLSDQELALAAEKVATWEKRRRERGKRQWEQSALIKEVRRRGLKEPPAPRRAVGIGLSTKRPLEWSDRELLAAAKQWSRRSS